jgi:hypothetical protein
MDASVSVKTAETTEMDELRSSRHPLARIRQWWRGVWWRGRVESSAWAGRIVVANRAIHPSRRFTLKVTRSATFGTVDVVADGKGLSCRAGTVLLALTARRLGLTDGLSGALAGIRERRSAHDPGRVFCDLAVMAADGGRCVSDLAVLAGQDALFGEHRVGADSPTGAAQGRRERA